MDKTSAVHITRILSEDSRVKKNGYGRYRATIDFEVQKDSGRITALGEIKVDIKDLKDVSEEKAEV